jgi:hypothetical protein
VSTISAKVYFTARLYLRQSCWSGTKSTIVIEFVQFGPVITIPSNQFAIYLEYAMTKSLIIKPTTNY